MLVNFQIVGHWFIQCFRGKNVVGNLVTEVYRVNSFAQKLFAGSLFEIIFIFNDMLKFENTNVVTGRCEQWMCGRKTARQLMSPLLRKLPVLWWTQGDLRETCVVCIEDFIEQEEVQVLPCSHGQFFLMLNFSNGP